MIVAKQIFSLAGLVLLHASGVIAQTFELASNSSITYRLEDDCIVSIQDMTGAQTKEACDARGLGCCRDDVNNPDPSFFPCRWNSAAVRVCRDSCVGSLACSDFFLADNFSSRSFGPGGCSGLKACQSGPTQVGANACVGQVACIEAAGTTVGDGACVGVAACGAAINSVIGSGSCASVEFPCFQISGVTIGDCVDTCIGSDNCPSEGIYDPATGMCGPLLPPTSSPVGMIGDPHVKTWGGEWFDFMGECDLVLLSATNFDAAGHDLNLHVRTTIRFDYSFTESAAIQIGGDILEVSSFGDYAVNGVDTPYLGGHAGRLRKYNIYHIMEDKKRHKFDIVIGPNENITISSFKDLVAVSINAGAASAKYFGNSVGIMGSYDGKLVARDGVTVIEDMNAFGQEWQVKDEEPMLFRYRRKPQYPSKCNLPPAKTASQRRLGERIPKRSAEVACSFLSGESFANCVVDVMAIGDLDVAKSYA